MVFYQHPPTSVTALWEHQLILLYIFVSLFFLFCFLRQKVLQGDFFLCNCTDEFMEAARHFIFETYCRIHHKIDIGMLADKMVS